MQQIKVRSPEKNLALDRAHFKLNAATIDPMYLTPSNLYEQMITFMDTFDHYCFIL